MSDPEQQSSLSVVAAETVRKLRDLANEIERGQRSVTSVIVEEGSRVHAHKFFTKRVQP